MKALLLSLALACSCATSPGLPPGYALGDDGEPYPTACDTCGTDSECEALCPEEP